MLPATIPCLRWLTLPAVLAVSQASQWGLSGFAQKLQGACVRGLRLLQIREPGMSEPELVSLLRECMAIGREHGLRITVNSQHPQHLWEQAGGVHLRSADLAVCQERPALSLVGASTHASAEITRAAALALDYAVLGPVLPTRSHPGEPGMGWAGLATQVSGAGLPVYAIGGMSPADLDLAMDRGAHGIAAIRSLWDQD